MVLRHHYSGWRGSRAAGVVGVTGRTTGLGEGGKQSVSPSSVAGTRSVAAAQDSSAGEGDSSGVVVSGNQGFGLAVELGLGLLPEVGSSAYRAGADRILSGWREVMSEVVGSSFAGLVVFVRLVSTEIILYCCAKRSR